MCNQSPSSALTRARARGAAYVEVLVIVGVVVVLGLLAVTTLGRSASEQAEKEANCIRSLSCGRGGGGNGGAPDLASTVGTPGSPGGSAAPPAPPGKGFWQATGDVASGFFVDGLWGTVTGLATIVVHPIDTVTGIAQVVRHPINSAVAIRDGVVQAWNDNPQRLIGAGIFEVVTLPLAAGKVAKVERVGTLAAAVRRVDRTAEVAAAARRVERVGEGADAAAEAARQAARVERVRVPPGAWPEPYPPPAPGATVIAALDRVPLQRITSSVQGEVQRSIVDAKIAEIRRILDGGPGRLPTVSLAPDGRGGLTLIDGNHTYAAYRELGFSQVPAKVYNEGPGVAFLQRQGAYNPAGQFPIGDMRTVDRFTGTPAQQRAARGLP